MDPISEIRKKQILELKEHCVLYQVNFNSMELLLHSEKIKRLQKRNHYIQQTIDKEIEKAIDNENK